MVVYIIGSLRNQEVPKIAAKLRDANFEVFDEWYSAGPNADDHLRDYAAARGLNHKEALQTYAARNIFEFDKRHLERADVVVLVMKGGLSGGIELGWSIGQGKLGYVLYPEDPERLDVMLQFAHGIFYRIEDLIEELHAKSVQQTSQELSKGCGIRGKTLEVGESVQDHRSQNARYGYLQVPEVVLEQPGFGWGV